MYHILGGVAGEGARKLQAIGFRDPESGIASPRRPRANAKRQLLLTRRPGTLSLVLPRGGAGAAGATPRRPRSLILSPAGGSGARSAAAAAVRARALAAARSLPSPRLRSTPGGPQQQAAVSAKAARLKGHCPRFCLTGECPRHGASGGGGSLQACPHVHDRTKVCGPVGGYQTCLCLLIHWQTLYDASSFYCRVSSHYIRCRFAPNGCSVPASMATSAGFSTRCVLGMLPRSCGRDLADVRGSMQPAAGVLTRSFPFKVVRDLMPVCSFFLDGVCSKEDCPYLHVNYPPNAQPCRCFWDQAFISCVFLFLLFVCMLLDSLGCAARSHAFLLPFFRPFVNGYCPR